MQDIWQLQEAKNKFSRVVDDAQRKGPQLITRRGEEAVVVLSVADYKRLKKQKGGLGDFLLQSPLHGSDLEIKRSRDLGRDIKL